MHRLKSILLVFIVFISLVPLFSAQSTECDNTMTGIDMYNKRTLYGFSEDYSYLPQDGSCKPDMLNPVLFTCIDKCLPEGKIRKFFCEPTSYPSYPYKLGYQDVTCGSKEYCDEGICKDACDDPDNENIYYRQEYSNGERDYCPEENSNNIMEYVCENNQLVAKSFECDPDLLCRNGYCAPVDRDADGVLDGVDKCLNTIFQDPIDDLETSETYGCSCSQGAKEIDVTGYGASSGGFNFFGNLVFATSLKGKHSCDELESLGDSCRNGIKDEEDLMVDCGGSCPSCEGQCTLLNEDNYDAANLNVLLVPVGYGTPQDTPGDTVDFYEWVERAGHEAWKLSTTPPFCKSPLPEEDGPPAECDAYWLSSFPDSPIKIKPETDISEEIDTGKLYSDGAFAPYVNTWRLDGFYVEKEMESCILEKSTSAYACQGRTGQCIPLEGGPYASFGACMSDTSNACHKRTQKHSQVGDILSCFNRGIPVKDQSLETSLRGAMYEKVSNRPFGLTTMCDNSFNYVMTIANIGAVDGKYQGVAEIGDLFSIIYESDENIIAHEFTHQLCYLMDEYPYGGNTDEMYVFGINCDSTPAYCNPDDPEDCTEEDIIIAEDCQDDENKCKNKMAVKQGAQVICKWHPRHPNHEEYINFWISQGIPVPSDEYLEEAGCIKGCKGLDYGYRPGNPDVNSMMYLDYEVGATSTQKSTYNTISYAWCKGMIDKLRAENS